MHIAAVVYSCIAVYWYVLYVAVHALHGYQYMVVSCACRCACEECIVSIPALSTYVLLAYVLLYYVLRLLISAAYI
jgi:hypothetical protein